MNATARSGNPSFRGSRRENPESFPAGERRWGFGILPGRIPDAQSAIRNDVSGAIRQRATDKAFRQRGLTLVETMVALVISLLLLAGLVTVFASVRSSFGTTSQLNQLVNQERLASDVIGNTLANAGYFPLANRTVTSFYPSPLTAFPSLATTVHASLDFVSGQVIYGTGATTPGSRNVVAIRMLTAPTDKGNILDCQGDTAGDTAGDAIERRINVLWVDTGKNQLMCSTSADPSGAPIIGGDRLPVKGTQYGGVTSLVALYGVDTDANGSVDRYLSAAQLNDGGYDICPDATLGTGNTSSCWPYVRSVRITLGMRSALAPNETLHFTRNVVLANAIGRNVSPPGLYVAPAAATGGG